MRDQARESCPGKCCRCAGGRLVGRETRRPLRRKETSGLVFAPKECPTQPTLFSDIEILNTVWFSYNNVHGLYARILGESVVQEVLHLLGIGLLDGSSGHQSFSRRKLCFRFQYTKPMHVEVEGIAAGGRDVVNNDLPMVTHVIRRRFPSLGGEVRSIRLLGIVDAVPGHVRHAGREVIALHDDRDKNVAFVVDGEIRKRSGRC